MRSARLALALLPLLLSSSFPEFNETEYFQFPINPGKTNYLAGTMGELRRGHFHGGIDVKTAGAIGLPIFSSAEGYISRVSISPTGYGRRLNVTHPNGYITVYAHLEKFAPEIEAKALELQYEKESFRLDYFPKPSEFPVKKGEVIAFSGNSGFSAAPHLHFEIRNEKNQQLNPLDFSFKEVTDSTPPIIQRILAIPKSPTTKIGGFQGPKEYSCFYDRENQIYRIRDTILVTGPFALQFRGYDKMSGNWNRTGIQGYDLELDGKKIFDARINALPVLLTKYINLHVDYVNLVKRNRWYHRIFKEKGNLLPFYKTNGNRGILDLSDDGVHEMEFHLKDALGNFSSAKFHCKRINEPKKMAVELEERPLDTLVLDVSQWNNFLKIRAKGPIDGNPLYLYSGSLKFELEKSFIEKDSYVFLWDLKKMILDSLSMGEQVISFNHKVMVPPRVEFSFFSHDLQIDFFRKTLFDTLILKLEESQQSISIGSSLDPLRGPMKISWTIQDTSMGTKGVHAYMKYGKSLDFIGGYWKDNKFVFSTSAFGTMVLAKDSIAPTIRYLGNKWGRLRFKIDDKMSGIKKYAAQLNGEWLMMEFDAKKSILVSKRKVESGPFSGDFSLVVQDNAGNKKEYNRKF